MFVGWKAKYGKAYKDIGEECRYKLFKGNRRIVVKLNAAAGEPAYGLTNEGVRECCDGSGGVQNNPEMEGKLSVRWKIVFFLHDAKLPQRLFRTGQSSGGTWVCRCIATELRENSESVSSAVPGDEAHMWI
ncbi:hypothetical protein ZWY2020_000399 [Hordeum vulgare]|nr:hypothetical protein ZWY2020_000399 [Hordeum vulgare]